MANTFRSSFSVVSVTKTPRTPLCTTVIAVQNVAQAEQAIRYHLGVLGHTTIHEYDAQPHENVDRFARWLTPDHRSAATYERPRTIFGCLPWNRERTVRDAVHVILPSESVTEEPVWRMVEM